MTDEHTPQAADEAPETTSEAADSTDSTADPEGPATPVDPDEAMREKYREALAHKHGASGAAQKGHGDSGSSAHSQSAGPSQRLFRRKSGG